MRDSPYGEALEGVTTLAQAQHRLAASVLWNLRVLAGWLPAGGAESLRALAAWYEIANVQARLAHFVDGAEAPALYELGTLETAARRLDSATSAAEVSRVLAHSRWGDPGGDEPIQIVNGMRAAWYQRVLAFVPELATAAEAALVLWAARARFGPGPGVLIPLRHLPGQEAGSLPETAAALPLRLRWVLEGIGEPRQLWQAEVRWWRRVEQEALRSLAAWRPGRTAMVATAVLLAADAWRVRAALAAAADRWDSGEALDAIA